MLLVDQGLNAVKRIRGIGYAEALRTGEIIYSSALLCGKAPVHTVVHHAGKPGKRHSLGVGLVYCIVGIYQKGNLVVHLLFICIPEVVEGLKVLQLSCTYRYLLSLVHSVGKYKFQRTKHIEEGGIVPAHFLTHLCGLNAADYSVIPGILQGYAPVHHGRNDYLVVIICRKAYSRPCKPCRLDQKLLGRKVPYPYGKRGHRKEYVVGGPDTHE